MSDLRIDGAGYSASSQPNLHSVQKDDKSISVFTKDGAKVKEPQEPQSHKELSLDSFYEMLGLEDDSNNKKAKKPKGELRKDELGVEYYAKMKRGREVKRTYVDEDNNVVMTQDIDYDSKGRKVKTKLKGPDGKKLYTSEYKYDKNGNMSLHEEKDAKGNVVKSEEFLYDFDGKNNKQITKDENGNITEMQEHKYNEKGRKSESVIYDGKGKYLGTRYYRYAPNGFEMGTSFEDVNGEVTHYYKEHTFEDVKD